MTFCLAANEYHGFLYRIGKNETNEPGDRQQMNRPKDNKLIPIYDLDGRLAGIQAMVCSTLICGDSWDSLSTKSDSKDVVCVKLWYMFLMSTFRAAKLCFVRLLRESMCFYTNFIFFQHIEKQYFELVSPFFSTIHSCYAQIVLNKSLNADVITGYPL